MRGTKGLIRMGKGVVRLMPRSMMRQACEELPLTKVVTKKKSPPDKGGDTVPKHSIVIGRWAVAVWSALWAQVRTAQALRMHQVCRKPVAQAGNTVRQRKGVSWPGNSADRTAGSRSSWR